MEKFHEKLKMLRKKEGLTQQEVADKIGIKSSVIFKLGKKEDESLALKI